MLKRKVEVQVEDDGNEPKRHRPNALAQSSPSSGSSKLSIAAALVSVAQEKAKKDGEKAAKDSVGVPQSTLAESASSSASPLFFSSSSSAVENSQPKKSDDGKLTKEPVGTSQLARTLESNDGKSTKESVSTMQSAPTLKSDDGKSTKEFVSTTQSTAGFFPSHDSKSVSVLSDAGLTYLQKVPPLELYRLIVDGAFHELEAGWSDYERRGPGDLAQIIQALAVAIREINTKPLTVNFIQNLHAICMAKKNYDVKGIHTPGEFRTPFEAPLSVDLPRDCSLAGCQEFFARMMKSKDQLTGAVALRFGKIIRVLYITDGEWDEKNRLELIKNIYEKMKLGHLLFEYYPYLAQKNSSVLPTQTIAECMQIITDSFNQAIAGATSQDAKIKVIIKHIKDYECLHPFIDGNTRVFVTVLTNFLLMQNGMCPVTFENPNIFYLLSDDELVERIKAAQENTMRLIAGEQLFKFDTNTLSSEAQQQFLEWAKPLRDVLATRLPSASNDKDPRTPTPK